jgi:hypothetical protein
MAHRYLTSDTPQSSSYSFVRHTQQRSSPEQTKQLEQQLKTFLIGSYSKINGTHIRLFPYSESNITEFTTALQNPGIATPLHNKHHMQHNVN